MSAGAYSTNAPLTLGSEHLDLTLYTASHHYNIKAIMPKVRIVADYGGNGYQLDKEARARGELPVSEPLKTRLSAWNDAIGRPNA